MRFEYPATFKPEGSSVIIAFRDIPEAITFANADEDPIEEAAGALQAALEVRIERDDEIPPPSSPRRGERLIAVPVETALKAALLLAMREQRKSKSSIAKDLEVDEKVVRRMLDPRHATKSDRLLHALAKLGKHPVVEVRERDRRVQAKATSVR